MAILFWEGWRKLTFGALAERMGRILFLPKEEKRIPLAALESTPGEVMPAKTASVLVKMRLPTGCLSSEYVSRRPGEAQPWTAMASFHARFWESAKPRFMPCPPAGEWQCAASPARKIFPCGEA